MFVFQFDNDNYRDRYRLSTFSAVIVPKRFEFRYPTLVVIKKIENPMTSCNRINRCDCWTVGLSMPKCVQTLSADSKFQILPSGTRILLYLVHITICLGLCQSTTERSIAYRIIILIPGTYTSFRDHGLHCGDEIMLFFLSSH